MLKPCFFDAAASHEPLTVLSSGDVAADTAKLQAAITSGYEQRREVHLGLGITVDQPIAFDPTGWYSGVCPARNTRFSMPEFHLKSIYEGAEPAFSVGPAPQFFNGHPRGMRPCFERLNIIRDNYSGPCFEIKDTHESSWGHVAMMGGSETLDIVSDVTGSWKNTFHHLSLIGENVDRGSLALSIRSIGNTGSNENRFSCSSITQNQRSISIANGTHNTFHQMEIARARTQVGQASIELLPGSDGTEFISCRIEQNFQDPNSFIINNQGDPYLRIYAGTVRSSSMSSLNYYTQSGTGDIRAQLVFGLPASLQLFT